MKQVGVFMAKDRPWVKCANDRCETYIKPRYKQLYCNTRCSLAQSRRNAKKRKKDATLPKVPSNVPISDKKGDDNLEC